MTEKNNQSRIKYAKTLLTLGIIALIITPLVYFAFVLIATTTCPQSDVGGCEFSYSIGAWQNGVIFTVLWAISSIIAISSGIYKLRVNKRSTVQNK